MISSVGTKQKKKQIAVTEKPALPVADRAFEQSLMTLENACLRVLDSRFASRSRDTDAICRYHRLKNIATPVSLALVEYKGPRRFHYHYRHRADDNAVLRPVLEPTPVDMLAMVCKDALRQSQREFGGTEDATLSRGRTLLENALLGFLDHYKEYTRRTKTK